ncbi:2682_t:CDS:2 [Funneliformis caledonium]|uniref:2682_t:CDS:1 n=1 Tax=Funneliformis caledonium TaxID=1117310 RepID=A0A9N8Z1K6_9GLOM|nr:2682_t:CDS:2 [Funneliformis caledonium]
MQRLPPAGWSRHHLVYPHRCIYCSPNSNPREYTRPVSQLSNPPLPMPEPTYDPFRFPDSHKNSAKHFRKSQSNDCIHMHLVNYTDTRLSVNDSTRVVSSVSDRESVVIDIKDEISEKISPMNNPSWWRRSYWVFLTLLNVYTLIGSIILILSFYVRTNPFESYNNAVSTYVFVIITALELAPRASNIYQIHQYSNGNICLCDVIAIMLGKKELYLLYGKTQFTEKQIDKMGYMTDALSLIYWIFLSYQIALEIQKNLGNSIEFIILKDRERLLMFSLLLTVTLLVLKMFWTLLRKCVHFVDKFD